MMRQTGGVAVAAISTRSSPFCRAIASACCGAMMPSCAPVSSMTRTSRTLIRSFTRVRSSRRGPLSKAIANLRSTRCLRQRRWRRLFVADFEQRRLDEGIDARTALVAARPAADRHRLVRRFPVARYQHIRHLLQLGFADLISNLFLPLIQLDPEPGLDQA